MKSVNYGQLPILLLQAIHELKAENESLRQQLQTEAEHHQTRQAQLEERLQRLEEAISVVVVNSEAADKLGGAAH
jgi:hypothetical protein